MPEIYEIKNRIEGLKSIHNITYAMQIVTISRLKRITTQLQKIKDSLQEVVNVLAYLVEEKPSFKASFFPQIDSTKQPLLVMFFSNRGFCGSFNQDVLNKALAFCAKEQLDFNTIPKICVGKKARLVMKHYKENISFHEPQKDLFSKDEGVALYDNIQRYIDESRHVYFVFFEFKSIISQKIIVDSFYPPSPKEFEPKSHSDEETSPTNESRRPHFVEPTTELVQDKMLEFYYYLKMFRAIRDSASSEFSQRFLLMKTAVDNVKSLQEELTMELNKERQRGITQEISEIISTFKALQSR
jgi:F-type H+-transporting ATPase subunit gamma